MKLIELPLKHNIVKISYPTVGSRYWSSFFEIMRFIHTNVLSK